MHISNRATDAGGNMGAVQSLTIVDGPHASTSAQVQDSVGTFIFRADTESTLVCQGK